MDLISDLLLLPITGPYRGLKALLGALRDEADATMLDASRVRTELSDLELRRDLGEISDEEYQEWETILLNRLNDILASEERQRAERRREERPRIVEGEVVDDAVNPVVGEVVGVESADEDSGSAEYVDGEYEYYDADDGELPDDGELADEVDGPAPDEDQGKGKGRGKGS